MHQQPGLPPFEAAALGPCVPPYLHREAEGEEKPLPPHGRQLLPQSGGASGVIARM